MLMAAYDEAGASQTEKQVLGVMLTPACPGGLK
jgi:hypothetical protein